MDLQNENQRLTRLRDEVKKEYIDATSRLQAEARVAQDQAERATAAKEAAEATAAAAQVHACCFVLFFVFFCLFFFALW